jgi:hypothetical protein
MPHWKPPFRMKASWQQAPRHQGSVDEDTARSAHADAATDLRPGETDVVAQQVGHEDFGPDGSLDRLPVQLE